MSQTSKASTFVTALAMFSMFFGAGNVIFPLAIGQYAKDLNFYAILGFLITGVGVPFLGLLSMTLFNGHYSQFFERIGKVPGFLVALIMMCLIGPFGATPRTLTVSFSTLEPYLPSFANIEMFSVISCMLIYFFTFRKSQLLDVLGKYLTPLLLGSLLLIIYQGFGCDLPESNLQASKVFSLGIVEGYQTMDL